MSTFLNHLFNFDRHLPEPFDKLSSKLVGVSSKYGSGTKATLCAPVVKAVHSMIGCMNGTGQGAVGTLDNQTVAEYKSSMGQSLYHLVVYDKNTGAIRAGIFDQDTEVLEQYTLRKGNQDGSAVMLALMPQLIADEEFNNTLVQYMRHRDAGYPDLDAATNDMAILCDNAYRRIKDETCAAHIKVSLDKSGNLMPVSMAQLTSGAYAPTTVVAGEFVVFANTARVTVTAAKDEIPHADFEGKYRLTPGRKLSVLEERLVPKLEDWYIIPDEVVSICKHAVKTTGKAMQMRNFLLRGPAGTGKTQGAMAIAAGLHLPYMKYTCSASTEVFDFVGMVFPKTDSMTTGDANLDKERELVQAMSGINYDNVAKLMNLPDLEDMDFDPVGTFQNLTGVVNESPTSRDCMGVVLELVNEKRNRNSYSQHFRCCR